MRLPLGILVFTFVSSFLGACAAEPLDEEERESTNDELRDGTLTLLDDHLEEATTVTTSGDFLVLHGDKRHGGPYPQRTPADRFRVTRYRAGRRDPTFGDEGTIEVGSMVTGLQAALDGGFYVLREPYPYRWIEKKELYTDPTVATKYAANGSVVRKLEVPEGAQLTTFIDTAAGPYFSYQGMLNGIGPNPPGTIVAADRPTFGNGGTLVVGESVELGGIDAQGRVYATTMDKLLVRSFTRFSPTGKVDSAYSNNVSVVLAPGRLGRREWDSPIVDARGRAIAPRFGDGKGAMLRLNEAGQLERTFMEYPEQDKVTHYRLDDRGRLVVASVKTREKSFFHRRNLDVLVARFLDDGRRDGTFDGDGQARFGDKGDDDVVQGIDIGAGRTYVHGRRGGSKVFFMALP